ncbi:4-hydroxythreonine-4-phosphate dehydrogenase PdxA [Prochlorothrix hollandica]|uniref:4-hydroxythreonine-4-phosphate dehydrogenase n=1 Tax=Prochlorothrix hollandica PCC 9006 = CALU 1027 TaxID=317619 RepID=A0A0M2PPA7_PROHO|nr:4-hydroxythreonine-4-phosphate dehydrogenase PdxA [Prochlorothrix hollandica]KKI98410.1 4-hydroxythreonine-4-phosphate dehydrogenase [Prochlorothrix hollandica PCC 9006 = CALU 1027]
MTAPRLIIPMGDPAGIGAEVTLKALGQGTPFQGQPCSITLVGDRQLWQDTHQQLLNQGQIAADPGNFPILHQPLPSPIHPGHPSAASGAASFAALAVAIDETLQGKADAIVTAPIAKSAWKMAGHLYPGQTEVLGQRAGVENVGMLFVARSPHTGWQLRTLLATTHIPLAQVPQTLTPALMTQKLDLLLQCLHQDFGLRHPRLAIAGLNPHSGEEGQLGREEQDWLRPWLGQMAQRHPQAHLEGPVPPDTLWVQPGRAWWEPGQEGHDGYLALYHDQGLIPVKLLAFDRAVNTSIGLPFVRTSPDHGTAFDIAGQGKASPSSMEAAIALALDLVHQRRSTSP